MTPHIEAKEGEIAKTVIMPGDPKRATMIAQTYLEDSKLVTSVRGMVGYTGTYKGKEVTVMASGMGCPSMGIYSYELYQFYGVEKIIRVGSVGAYTKDLNLYDLILVNSSYSDSNYAFSLDGYKERELTPSSMLNDHILEVSEKLNKHIKVGRVFCTDSFYGTHISKEFLIHEKHCLGAEMETFALFSNARHFQKEAACILTVSDNLETKEETTPEERQNAFTEMIVLALESL